MTARLRQACGLLLAAAVFAAAAPGARAHGGQPQDPVAQASADARKAEPFAFADFTWLTGNPRTKDLPLDTKVVTGEFRVDTSFTYSFNHPKDDTISGSSEVFRSGEFQVTQLGIGGDFHVRQRPRPADDAVRHVLADHAAQRREPGARPVEPRRRPTATSPRRTAGTTATALNGINVDAGIFMSYVGLCSYYQFDNWTYQPSYVSSNTPWFFNGRARSRSSRATS